MVEGKALTGGQRGRTGKKMREEGRHVHRTKLIYDRNEER